MEAQLKAEEAEMTASRKLRGQDKVAARKAQAVSEDADELSRLAVPTLEARNIEDAIALLSISTDEGVRAAAGGGGGGVAAAAAAAAAAEEAHPEKRMKAAWARFKDRELPLLKEEFPSLRLSQLQEMLKRKWDKSPENPMVATERAKAAAGASAWKEKS